jgi:uncharacterized protein YceK
MKRWLTPGIILIVLLPWLTGCQTFRSWNSGCPGIYSGVRFFASQQSTLPPDGQVFFLLDFPLTFVTDTLLLPAAFLVEPSEPKSGWVPGCRWVK